MRESTKVICTSGARLEVGLPACLRGKQVGRQGTLSPDEWWDLQMSGHPAHPLRSRGGDRLPDKLLRLGVRYSDGAKATTVERHGLARPPLADPPVGPVLSWIPAGLWPLPPADTIEFAVEWPFGGISLTIVELDGAAIVSAAERSTRCWPDSSEHDPP